MTYIKFAHDKGRENMNPHKSLLHKSDNLTYTSLVCCKNWAKSIRFLRAIAIDTDWQVYCMKISYAVIHIRYHLNLEWVGKNGREYFLMFEYISLNSMNRFVFCFLFLSYFTRLNSNMFYVRHELIESRKRHLNGIS